MTASFVIDALPERAAQYRAEHALVAVDVFRATTVILTALASGRAVFPVSTLEDARARAMHVPGALLAGEQHGVVPEDFDLDNSPALLECLPGCEPVILLTSAGTRLLENCRGACSIYVACLRNLTVTAEHLATCEERVALIGAGTAGEARPEDQFVCARIGHHLLEHGFVAENEATARAIAEYSCAEVGSVLRASRSAAWLRSAGKWRDLQFTLTHVNDLPLVATVADNQVTLQRSVPRQDVLMSLRSSGRSIPPRSRLTSASPNSA